MRKRLAGILVALLVAVGAAACGDQSGPSALEVVSKASDATAAAKSARMVQKISTGTGKSAFTMTLEGVIDFTKSAALVTMSLKGVEGAGFDSEMRIVGTSAYVKLPEPTEDGKLWAKSDLSQFGSGFGSDPTATLGYLTGVSGEVRRVGTQKVRGVKTTRYHATVDLKKAAASAENEQAREALEELTAQGINHVPTDVWVDEAGRARRTHMVIDFTKSTKKDMREAGKLTLIGDLFDFGVAVEVEAPPESETTGMEALQGSDAA